MAKLNIEAGEITTITGKIVDIKYDTYGNAEIRFLMNDTIYPFKISKKNIPEMFKCMPEIELEVEKKRTNVHTKSFKVKE